MELQLFVSQGSDDPPQLYSFKEPGRIVLGRGPESPIPLDGPSISREHLAFELRDGQVVISDLSSNGSFLNGQRLPRGAQQHVVEEDEIGVPGYAISFRLVGGQPEEPPPPPPPPQAATEPAEKKTAAPSRAAAVEQPPPAETRG